MSQVYECMILLSNQVVREDWRKAKAMVEGFLTKHGASVKSLRRYEERRLSYPMNKNMRATYYLAYFEIAGGVNAGEAIPNLRREFELSEVVLRHLILAVDEMPEEELALAALENDSEYTVPAPPADDAPTEEELAAEAAERAAEEEAEAAKAGKPGRGKSDEGKSDEGKSEEGKSDEGKSEESKGDEPKKEEAKADATAETKTEADAPKEA